jgi:hypothetical protein
VTCDVWYKKKTFEPEKRTSHVTRHTSHVTRHTSHVARHTSHVTRRTSHVTCSINAISLACGLPAMESSMEIFLSCKSTTQATQCVSSRLMGKKNLTNVTRHTSHITHHIIICQTSSTYQAETKSYSLCEACSSRSANFSTPSNKR